MISDILNFVAAFILGWTMIGGGLLYGKAAKTIYIPLSKSLIGQGKYDEAVHRKVVRNGWLGPVVAVGVGLLFVVCMWYFGDSAMPLLMGALGTMVGLFKGRNIQANRKALEERFRLTHQYYL